MTRDEKRYQALHDIGCIACRIKNYTPCGIVTIHHLVDKGYRKHSGGNQATIPLGQWHHQGIPYIDLSLSYMRSKWGPSLALEKREFVREFGSERELLAMVNEMLTWGQRGEMMGLLQNCGDSNG